MARIPLSTYRLQFCREFTFQDAEALVPYLDELGIGWIYASPVLKARPGSPHGYDITDPGQLNPEIGGPAELRALHRALSARGMGLMMDVVPNHLCIASGLNRYWNDVLENGPGSPYARFFDIDFSPPKQELRDKILYPVLHTTFGQALEEREIRISYDRGAFSASYRTTPLPLAPLSWTRILEPVLEGVQRQLGELHPDVLELSSILSALSYLPPPTCADPTACQKRQREKLVITRRLLALCERRPEIEQAIRAQVEALNGQPGVPHSFDALELLLQEQAYRLSYWRVAAEEINYRRFFDINDLAAIRVEDGAVFQAVHGLLLGLVAEGLLSGLRIDHVDGLLSPRRYLRSLQRAIEKRLPTPQDAPFYIVVEKILAGEERLHPDWPVFGTTGYDFLALCGGLFVERGGAAALTELYGRLTGMQQPFADVVYESKKLILQVGLSAELHVLACKLDHISEQHRRSRDFAFHSLKSALAEVIACFPVYRTYIEADDDGPEAGVRPEDLAHITYALRTARRRNPAVSASIFDFIGEVLLKSDPDGLDPAERAERRDFLLRFQQLTGPVMAKGLEDTAFYRHFPLLSLCEVGAGPASAGISVADFHRSCLKRQKELPHSLLTTSTHDTKRGEDVRARLHVLSEIPAAWEAAVQRWQAANRHHKRLVEGQPVPDDNDEYHLYQTLIGAWPMDLSPPGEAFVGRIAVYLEKALREAKRHTSWINPNEPYEQAAADFLRAILRPDPEGHFLQDLLAFLQPVAWAGRLTSLSQVLLKITAPGVPDLYQGSELWDLSLVDPDNRRPVDFAHRRELLHTLPGLDAGPAAARALLAAPEDGRIKLLVGSRALRCRRALPALFSEGEYVPVAVQGPLQEHVIAYKRRHGPDEALIVATRLFIRLGAPPELPVGALWHGTELLPDPAPAARYRDALCGHEVAAREGAPLPLREILAHLHIALLVKS